MKRTVFLISDRTGITVETLVHTLLTQFDQDLFERVTLPFTDTIEKIHAAVQQINAAALQDGVPPLVFSSLVDAECREGLRRSRGVLFDFFDDFIWRLEEVLGRKSAHAVGRSHGIGNVSAYDERVEAVNFALNYDDGAKLKNLGDADLVLLGVSRSGKTPTCLYLALQFGIRAANYPLTEDDFPSAGLPPALEDHRAMLFGLSIAPERLQQIRLQRRPASDYSSLAQCRREIQWAERLYTEHRIPFVNTTAMSIEEIAAAIMHRSGVKRRVF
jgi:regulator of PEP synthase PpsR (kinase-PPPase family)